MEDAQESYHICHPSGQKCRNQGIQFPKLVATQHRMQEIIVEDSYISSWRAE